MSRVLAVDPGDARIGLAISDESRIVARPLMVLEHQSRTVDAEAIVRVAREQEAGLIVVGVPFGIDGEAGPQAQKALRLADALRATGAGTVELWDESGSTLRAQQIDPSTSELDARAAAVILQDFLDAKTG